MDFRDGSRLADFSPFPKGFRRNRQPEYPQMEFGLFVIYIDRFGVTNGSLMS